jgi:DNA-binding NarL/FixJ family response regulator
MSKDVANAFSEVEPYLDVPESSGECFEAYQDEVQLLVCSRINSLSPNARHILELLSEGWSNKSIAWQLSVSEATIKAHVTTIMRVLGCSNRTQAALIALFSSQARFNQARTQIGKIAFQRRR